MKRDEYGIIIQPDGAKILVDGVEVVIDDGGDSSFSTGLNSWAGSEKDFQLMPLFIVDGKLVRHPYQSHSTGTASHNDPSATSADQVKGFFSGLHGRANEVTHAKVKEACLNYAKGWRVNKDVLTPANKVYLYKCADTKPPLWLSILAYPIFKGELFVNTKINPSHEQTQFPAMCCIMGKKYIVSLVKNHPNLFENMENYFCGWRKRCEIFYNMERKIVATIQKP
jgi:hypothetical protein